jgi:hypothetical protein
MAPSFPIFNGQRASWADIVVKVQTGPGLEIETGDFTKLDWEDAVDGAHVRGEGGGIAGDTKGSYTPKATIAMLAAGFKKLQGALILSYGNRRALTDCYFNIIASWTPVGDVNAILEQQKVEILNARIISRKSANQSGSADAKTIEKELLPKDIRLNGISLFYPPSLI